MPPDETLARRVRAALAPLDDVEEKKMFGGLAFLVNGKMCVAVGPNDIMLRIDPDECDAALARPGCEPVSMGGRTMRGYVRIGADHLDSPSAFDEWIALAVGYNPRAPQRRR